MDDVLWYLLIISLTIFSKLFHYAKKELLIVIPLSPDREGGLSKIGDVSFTITLIISSGMLFVIAWMVVCGLDKMLVIGFILYLVILIASFFLPLKSVHLAMKTAKRKNSIEYQSYFKMNIENQHFVELQKKSEHALNNEGIIKNTIEHMSYIDQLYRRVETMPVWLFNLNTWRKFTTVIAIPIILFIIQLVTENAITK